ncbi:MAG: PEP-CTERM sorting domain-containing protein [Planctomycetota bacterium]
MLSRVFALATATVALLALSSSSAVAQDIYENGAVNSIDIPSIDILVQDSVDPLPTTVNIGANGQVGWQLNPDGTIVMTPVLDDDGNPVPELDDMDMPVLDGMGNPVFEMEPVPVDAPSIVVTGNSIVNMADGSLTTDSIVASGDATVDIAGFVGNDLEISGNARVLMNGGRIDDDAFFESTSRLEVTSGRFDDELQFFDDTTALFTGGEVRDDLVVADNAQVVIEQFSVSDAIEASGTSTTTITNGSFGAIEAVDGAVVNAAAAEVEEALGAATGSTITIGDLTTSTATDAEFEITANNSGVVEFTETARFGDLTVNARIGGEVRFKSLVADDLVVNVDGGEMLLSPATAETLDVNAALGGVVRIERGRYGSASLQALSNSIIEIVGKDFVINGIPFGPGDVPFSAGTISATLADGQDFFALFQRQFSPLPSVATIRLILVPEPTTAVLVMLGLAGIACRRRG